MTDVNALTQGVETPATLIELPKLEANLTSMQRLADANGVALRPHAKTHKSIEIGSRQLALGASGLTVATIDEAVVFARDAKAGSITISRPIVSETKLDRLFAELGDADVDLRIVVDSEDGVAAADAAAARASRRPGLFIKVDVGLHRCGVDPHSSRTLDLARQIDSAANLEFRGILSHAGQVYAVTSRAEATAIAEQERVLMLQVRDQLNTAGIAVAEVSVGSTPTVLAAESFEGVTEIRPGNYVFFDLLPAKVGVATEAEASLSVLATVISKNDEYFITDAGSKTLTSDTGGHGMVGAQGFGVAYPTDRYLSPEHRMLVAGLSEEHGKLARGDFDLAVGSTVRIIPNHSCPVVNLARELLVLDGEECRSWPIDAACGSR